MKAGTSTPGEDRESGPITRSGICQRVDDLPQAGHSRRDQVHTDNDGGSLFYEKGTKRPTPEGGRGAAPRPGGWARIPIWGRGNDYRLRGLPTRLGRYPIDPPRVAAVLRADGPSALAYFPYIAVRDVQGPPGYRGCVPSGSTLPCSTRSVSAVLRI